MTPKTIIIIGVFIFIVGLFFSLLEMHMGHHPNNWEGWIFTDTDAIKTKGRLGSDPNPSTPLIISPATERLLEAKRSDNTEFLVIDHEGNFTVNGKKDFTKEELKTAIIEMVRLMSKILGINVYAGNLNILQSDRRNLVGLIEKEYIKKTWLIERLEGMLKQDAYLGKFWRKDIRKLVEEIKHEG